MLSLRRSRSALADEQGSVTLFFLVIAVGMFFMIGLAYDISGTYADVQNANSIAEEIARTGAQCVDVNEYLATGTATVADLPTVQACAQKYLDVLKDGGVSLVHPVSLRVKGVPVTRHGTEVHVEVLVQRPVLFLSALGFDHKAYGQATVKLTQGVTDSGG